MMHNVSVVFRAVVRSGLPVGPMDRWGLFLPLEASVLGESSQGTETFMLKKCKLLLLVWQVNHKFCGKFRTSL